MRILVLFGEGWRRGFMRINLSAMFGKPEPECKPTDKYAFVTQSGRTLMTVSEEKVECWSEWFRMSETPEVDFEEDSGDGAKVGNIYVSDLIPFEVD
jgi:hypothetical protein